MWLYQNLSVKKKWMWIYSTEFISKCEYAKNVNIKNLVVSKFEHTKINLVTLDIFTYLNHFLILPHFEGQAWCSGEKPTH